MVAPITEPTEELAPPVDTTADFGAEEPVVDETPAEEEAAPQTPEVEADPFADTKERLDIVERGMQRLSTLNPDQIQSLMGLIPGLQSTTDQLKNADPLADIAPRLAAAEQMNADLVRMMLGSDLVDDASKTALQQSLAALDQDRSSRDVARQVREQVSAQIPAQPEATPQAPDQAQLAVLDTAAQLKGYAAAKAVEWSAIPDADLNFRPNETVDAAATRVRAVIDGLASEESAPARVAERAQAAGTGTPGRSGATQSDEAFLARAEADGIPMTDVAGRKRLAKLLGMDLPD